MIGIDRTFANLINNRLSIFPNKNLICNIGDDNSALHSNPKKWNNLKLENMKFPLTSKIYMFR